MLHALHHARDPLQLMPALEVYHAQHLVLAAAAVPHRDATRLIAAAALLNGERERRKGRAGVDAEVVVVYADLVPQARRAGLPIDQACMHGCGALAWARRYEVPILLLSMVHAAWSTQR